MINVCRRSITTGISLIIGMGQHMQHLSLRQLFITNPSGFIGLKKSVDFIFLNFQDNFRISGTPGQTIKIRDCPGQSWTYGMYAFGKGLKLEKESYKHNLLPALRPGDTDTPCNI